MAVRRSHAEGEQRKKKKKEREKERKPCTWVKTSGRKMHPRCTLPQLVLGICPICKGLNQSGPIAHPGGKQRIKKGKPNWEATTPLGVDPFSCLQSAPLTACSINYACLSYPGLSCQFFAVTIQNPGKRTNSTSTNINRIMVMLAGEGWLSNIFL